MYVRLKEALKTRYFSNSLPTFKKHLIYGTTLSGWLHISMKISKKFLRKYFFCDQLKHFSKKYDISW